MWRDSISDFDVLFISDVLTYEMKLWLTLGDVNKLESQN